MTRRDYLFLGLLGLTIFLLVSAFQAVPGYMDADYYYAGGLQLASGKGFTEPYLWNYLDDPSGLPHPSHTYWMPLASILAAIVPLLTGNGSWFTARIPFLLAAACIPPITAALAFTLTSRRSPAMISGLLAVFPGFYLPFLTTTDTFALYMLFGGLFFLTISRIVANQRFTIFHSLVLGLLSGLMHLSRADGLLWLVIALMVIFSFRPAASVRRSFSWYAIRFILAVSGYLLIMTPWFQRNISIFGSLLAPGNSKMLWLTSYDQIFSFPATDLSFTHWQQSGLGSILKARTWALGLNLANTFTVQGSIFLLPLILFGLWHQRKEKMIRIAVITWVLVFAAMTLAFPFAGARGGFFHSGAALQTVWWAVTPLGLEQVLEWGSKKRGWQVSKARPVFMAGLVGLAILFSILVLMLRLPDWRQEASTYREIGAFLETNEAKDSDIVIVSNPPGFYLASSHPAIAIPDGEADTVLELAQRYDARYLILEEGSMPAGLLSLYESPENNPGLVYLGEVKRSRVFAIEP